MRAVGIKVLKNKLSEYVRLAASGETVLVTDRDKVVAELVPPRPGRAGMLSDARLAEAVRKGWIRPPIFARDVPDPVLGGDIPSGIPNAPLSEILADLDWSREDRV